MEDVKAVEGPRISRRERAQRTRQRIVDAAYTLFVEQGYAATTMDAIASRAGVAVQTVYFVFHTKAELLVAMLKMLGGGPEPTPDVMARSWIQEIVAAPDGARRLAIASEYGTEIYQRLGPVFAAVAAAASGDAEVRAAWRRIVDGRRDGMGRIVGLMAQRGELRPGLDPDVARDILSGVHRHELFLAFTVESGWSFDRYRAWTFATLCRQLLPDAIADAALAPGSPATTGMSFATALPDLSP